jgi:hypothetical protein
MNRPPQFPGTLRAAALACALVATSGCVSKQDQQRSLDELHKELRWQEDQIYQLQDAIEEYQQALANCRAGQRPAADSQRETSRAPARPRVEDDRPSSVPDLPDVELGEPDDADSAPPVDNSAPDDPPSLDDEPRPLKMSSAHVEQIRLHTVLTGGIDRDGLPGDEGIQVVVEPMDAKGHVVPVTGAVAIALMDHTLPTGDQRLAFWTFDAARAAKKVRRGGLSDGLLFDLMWGGQRYPTHRELDVYVRYTTTDGRQLDARGKVKVRLPEDVAAWKKPEPLPPATARQPSTIRPVAGFESAPSPR